VLTYEAHAAKIQYLHAFDHFVEDPLRQWLWPITDWGVQCAGEGYSLGEGGEPNGSN